MKRENRRRPQHEPDIPGMIRSLERRIVDYPEDIEPYYHLGHLYECAIGDDALAKANYLQYLVRSLGYADADEAITALGRAIEVQADDCMAHINLGQVYCYLNRFEEAEARLKAGTRWLTFETSNYRLNVIPGSQAHRDIESIKRRREDALARIQEVFKVAYDRKGAIVYYFYESRVHKGMLTGDQMPGHAFTDRSEVHVVYNRIRQVDTPHEDVHIVLRPLGRPPKLIEEGAALYIHQDREADGSRFHTGESIAPGIIMTLLDDHKFAGMDFFLVYPIAHSFTRFLVSEYGMDVFKTLYGLATDKPFEAFDRVYGKRVSELEGEWLKSVDFEVAGPKPEQVT